MTRTGKRILLLTIGSVLALSIVVFLVLALRFDRRGDANNENELLARARAAEKRGEVYEALDLYRRLARLNQFKPEYVEACSNMLAAADAREKAVDERVDKELETGRFAAALDILRGEVGHSRRPMQYVLGIELCALARRTDLMHEFIDGYPVSGRGTVLFELYADALTAWVADDPQKLIVSMKQIDHAIRTPMAKLMDLEAAASGDDATLVMVAWKDFVPLADFLDFRQRGKLAVKRFLGAHFPDKLPVTELGVLADEMLKTDEPDRDILKVSLLAKLATKTLLPEQVESARQKFPDDKGFQMIERLLRMEILGK